ncbi:Ribonuclease Trv-like protein [Hapsidospora chrysogenum ATCC 11550]|uniref:ribonuclease T2 n=1 Tax=Hapsidospora chrysogenum (strain ATCC 11550 / CBS 779.69 / DSM 880 / IAM 14645 / JCM 23072 / IMI 49137) TaxID=857340 RepID=A0A086TEL5_HAPC1|nr:Ribonuclease Trv-like protein [Hapsidospora chrysogenum ATCC 11550]
MYRKGALVSISALAQLAAAGLYPGISKENHTCVLSDPILSCSEGADPSQVDTCCVETYGGLVLQTQYWNTYTGLESKGQLLPQYEWTIHGLWPDFCNGSYTQYCDLSRQYDPEPYPNTTNGEPDGTPVPPYKGEPIDRWFEPNGKTDVLEYMKKRWVGLGQPSWILWAHEYSKHATCFSTFQEECYTTIAYYRTLPSWGWLSAASIRPSNTTAYSLSSIQGALTQGFGELPFVGCGGPKYNETEAGRGSDDNGGTVLNEIWYYYHVYGASQRNQGVRVPAPDSFRTTCAKAKDAIWYYERTEGSEK